MKTTLIEGPIMISSVSELQSVGMASVVSQQPELWTLPPDFNPEQKGPEIAIYMSISGPPKTEREEQVKDTWYF